MMMMTSTPPLQKIVQTSLLLLFIFAMGKWMKHDILMTSDVRFIGIMLHYNYTRMLSENWEKEGWYSSTIPMIFL